MPIDASIPLGFRPPVSRAPDPSQTLMQGLQLRDLVQRGQARDVAMEKQRLDLEREEALRKAFVPGDMKTTLANINKIDPALGFKLENQLATQQREQSKVDLELQRKVREDLAGRVQALISVEDPVKRAELWTSMVRPEMAKTGLYGDELPEELPDDETINFFGMAVLPADKQRQVLIDWAKEQREAETARLTQEKTRQEIERLANPRSIPELMFMATNPQYPEEQRIAAGEAVELLQQYRSSGGGGEMSLQERLVALRMVPEEQRTAAQQSEIDEIERAMTLVADAYGAGFKTLATPGGQPVYFKPGTGEAIPAPEGTRQNITAGEREELSLLDVMLGQIGELRPLAEDNRNAIGPVEGRYADLKRKYVGASDEVNQLFRLSDNLSDMLLRARSGAQINEQEYKRLRTLVPNPRLTESKFFSDLNSFEKELRAILGRRSGEVPLNQNLQNQTDDPLGLFGGRP